MGAEQGKVTPDACDCCGHDAEDCGMLEQGWVSDTGVIGNGGVYCRPCAHLLRLVRIPEQCLWCETPMVEEETAEVAGWGYYVDGYGALHPCCPGCLEDRFGILGVLRVRRTA